MRQETGNSTNNWLDYGVEHDEFHSIANAGYTEQKELSIQITLNGFSFVVLSATDGVTYDSGYIHFQAEMSDIRNYDAHLWHDYARVMVGFASDHTLLIPYEMFDPNGADLYLSAANMINANECCTMINNTLCDTLSPQLSVNERCAAVWQTDNMVASQILTAYPNAYVYNSLQLHLPATYAAQSIVVSLENYTEESASNTAHIVIRDSRLTAAETVTFHTVEELLYYTRNMIKQDGFTGYKVYIVGQEADQVAPIFAQFFASVESIDNPYYIHQRISEI